MGLKKFKIIIRTQKTQGRNIKGKMEKQSTFEKDLIESQIQFKNQFNPNSDSYHKGILDLVPTGGQRIPETMNTMYPEGYDPNQQPIQEVIDYGEQYRKIEQDRLILQNLKKSLAKICPIVQAFMRHDVIFKQKGDPTNQKHLKTHEQNIAKQNQNLAKAQQQLKAFIPKLDAIDAQGAQMAKQLVAILQQSNKKHESKESLTDFNFQVKKTSTKSFSQANKCLQRLKDIKKNYKKPQTTAN